MVSPCDGQGPTITLFPAIYKQLCVLRRFYFFFKTQKTKRKTKRNKANVMVSPCVDQGPTKTLFSAIYRQLFCCFATCLFFLRKNHIQKTTTTCKTSHNKSNVVVSPCVDQGPTKTMFSAIYRQFFFCSATFLFVFIKIHIQI